MFVGTNISGKAKAPKGSKMRIRGNLVKKNLIREFVLQKRCGMPINQIHNCKNTIAPENKRKARLNLQCSSNG